MDQNASIDINVLILLVKSHLEQEHGSASHESKEQCKQHTRPKKKKIIID